MPKQVKPKKDSGKITYPTAEILDKYADDYAAFEEHRYAKKGCGFRGSGHAVGKMFGDVEDLNEAFNPLNVRKS